jgi:hypothetical protein
MRVSVDSIWGVAFCLFFVIAGIVVIYGAYSRWPMLVDPPETLWLTYSQAGIKRLFGQKFLLFFTYFLGILFILVGAVGFWNGVKNW